LAAGSPQLRTSTLPNTDFRWSRTVRAEMASRAATSEVDRPAPAVGRVVLVFVWETLLARRPGALALA